MRAFSRALPLLFLAAVLVAAYGFFSDDRTTEAAAQQAACAARGPRCTARLARLQKTPLWRELHFRIGAETVVVRCTRSAYLVGEHRCVSR